ncbi:hypothetical protein [Agromyces larvae]|uniref:GNAT family N-acetyltransferase n=1 Tax=Agromyces larvae TaxID=2929802 RepID=A0ABY4BYD2_9MICO|nr:hypothetical protein [Agromyces larvae]UOE44255.1 hypothetical protein MTO99_00180 [Agromyces larvae]
MTDSSTPGAAAAAAAADAEDATAGVVTRAARPDELDAVIARFEATWGAGTGPDRSLLRAAGYAGATVLVAVPATPGTDAPGRDAPGTDAPGTDAPPPASTVASGPIVGAAFGFLGWAGGIHLHSHMNAVDPAHRGRGVGVALKLRQRAVCLAHGVGEIRWTYDPLIRRNARMNLVRLGAEVGAYLPDFYGELRDAINLDDRSDRFEVRWRLDSPRVRRALERRPQPAWHADGEGLALVADFEAVRGGAPDIARELRERSRVAFAAAFADGLRPELDARGDYVFTADDPDLEAR